MAVDRRVSTPEQDATLQLDALEAAGCARVFADVASGALDERSELARALDLLRAGDTRVVWRLDRLGRSLRHLSTRSPRWPPATSGSAASRRASTRRRRPS